MAKKYIPGDFKLKPKRSSAGLGLFTDSPIKKGACVIEYVGRPITESESYNSNSLYLFEINSKITIDGRARSNTARYINHSCRPNCEPVIHQKRIFIMARKNIKAGEELTYDYGKEYYDDIIKSKGCRCQKCQDKK